MITEGVVTPSSEMWAVVRHGDPPELVPDDLLPYVVPSYVDGDLDDWSLTDDVIAFGDVETPMAYQRWRATWERAWPLDPRSNLIRLTELGRELAAELALGSELLMNLADDAHGDRTMEGPAALLQLATELERVRDAVRERKTTGYGFVDVTDGRSRVGLARAWSPSAGAEVLAADQYLEASMRPASGLHIEIVGPPRRSLDAVEEVAVRSSGVEIVSADGFAQLPPEESAALTWIVPGAARWRVRPVPEVLVWARTFGGLPECCRYAAALERPMTLRDNHNARRPDP